MLPTSHSASQPFWHGPSHTAHLRIQGLSLSVATGSGGMRGFAYGSPPLPTRDSQPAEDGQVAVIGAVAAPGASPATGAGVWGLGQGQWACGMGRRLDEVHNEGSSLVVETTPWQGALVVCASGTNINETETVPCQSHPETPQGLCQNRALGAGNCPIRLLPAGIAGPAPPFVPRSAQEEVVKQAGPAVNITENRAQSWIQDHECNPHRSGPQGGCHPSPCLRRVRRTPRPLHQRRHLRSRSSASG